MYEHTMEDGVLSQTGLQRAVEDLQTAQRRAVPSVGELNAALSNAQTLLLDDAEVMEQVHKKIVLLELKRGNTNYLKRLCSEYICGVHD